MSRELFRNYGKICYKTYSNKCSNVGFMKQVLGSRAPPFPLEGVGHTIGTAKD